MLSDQIMQEIDAADGLTLAQLARRCPRTRQNRPVSLGCVLRWVISGVRGPNGETIRLEAVRLAGRWISTPGALRRFILAQTPTGEPPPSPRTASRRQRAADRAGAELDAAGV